MTSNQYDRSNILPVLAYIVLGLIWGTNFIFMKIATYHISPMQIVFLRVLFGLLPILAYSLFSGGMHRSHLRYLPHFFVMALLATAVYLYCFAKGTSLLFSGVAGAISGAVPLFSIILAILFLPEEKATTKKTSGVLIGFFGVFLIAQPTSTSLSDSNLLGAIYMLLGSLCVGSSFTYAKKFITHLNIPAPILTTYQLTIALIILTAATDFTGISAIAEVPWALLGVVVGMGLLGTGCAYMLYYYIVKELGAVAASSVTFVPPVVALLIGALLVGEPIDKLDYLATLLIIIGVLLLRK